jgi:transcriptional regulator with PAS, ATPase and Fis domain
VSDEEPPEQPRPLRPTEADERSIILTALRRAEGNKSLAAKSLGIGRTTLWRRMKELGIDWPSYPAVFRRGTLGT